MHGYFISGRDVLPYAIVVTIGVSIIVVALFGFRGLAWVLRGMGVLIVAIAILIGALALMT